MRNQAQEIYDCINTNPGVCTEDIVNKTGWNRHLVELAIKAMIKQELIREVGKEEWGDPRLEVFL